MISAPIFDAISFCDATIPFWARVGTETAESVSEKRAQAEMTSRARRCFMPRIIAARAQRPTVNAKIAENAKIC